MFLTKDNKNIISAQEKFAKKVAKYLVKCEYSFNKNVFLWQKGGKKSNIAPIKKQKSCLSVFRYYRLENFTDTDYQLKSNIAIFSF